MLNLSNVEFNFLWLEIKTVSVSSAFLAFRRTTSAITESELAIPAAAITTSRAATKEASPTAAITASARAMLAIKASKASTMKASTTEVNNQH